MSLAIDTIGHSTRSIEDFLELLHTQGITQLIDVRTIPRSRYNPQFNSEPLAQSLHSGGGIQYRHLPALGGLRTPEKDSVNQGWRNKSFRGYADYMQTAEFLKGLDELMASSERQRTAIMCAEAVPWRCHRSLIADALVARGWNVRHILSANAVSSHHLTSFARIADHLVWYPKPDEPSSAPRLF